MLAESQDDSAANITNGDGSYDELPAQYIDVQKYKSVLEDSYV